MAGSAKATVVTAAGRAIAGALLTVGATFFATIGTVDDDCNATNPPITEGCETGSLSAQEKASYAALAAGLTYLIARGGLEGTLDAARQANNSPTTADVQA